MCIVCYTQAKAAHMSLLGEGSFSSECPSGLRFKADEGVCPQLTLLPEPSDPHLDMNTGLVMWCMPGISAS